MAPCGMGTELPSCCPRPLVLTAAPPSLTHVCCGAFANHPAQLNQGPKLPPSLGAKQWSDLEFTAPSFQFFFNSTPKCHQVFAGRSQSSSWVCDKPVCGSGSGIPCLVPH